MKHHATKRSLFFMFRKGFLSFFLLDENPIRQYAKRRKRISDEERIYGDWCNIGNDIRNAYEKYQQATTCR